ncbi:MAG: peptidylprolyl isomerase [Bacteroidetes bacterium]|nr:peptidylprolyl isomerase [Bacteroidota bacterium]
MKLSALFFLPLLITSTGIETFNLDESIKSKNPIIRISTEIGEIEIEIFEKEAPVTANNFLEYIKKGMFKNACFYRVVNMENQPDDDIKIEVIQGGLGWSDSLPGLGPIKHETTDITGIKHLDGTLSMARDKPGSASSEFFICINNQLELDYGGKRNPDGQGFAAFGKVIKGMDVVKKIQKLDNTNQMLDNPVMILDIIRLELIKVE